MAVSSVFSMDINVQDITKCVGEGCKVLVDQGTKVLANPNTVLILNATNRDSLLATVGKKFIISTTQWCLVPVGIVAGIGFLLKKKYNIASKKDLKKINEEIKKKQKKEIDTASTAICDVISAKKAGLKDLTDQIYSNAVALNDSVDGLSQEIFSQNEKAREDISNNIQCTTHAISSMQSLSKEILSLKNGLGGLVLLGEKQKEKLKNIDQDAQEKYDNLNKRLCCLLQGTHNSHAENLQFMEKLTSLNERLSNASATVTNLSDESDKMMIQASNLQKQVLEDAVTTQSILNELKELNKRHQNNHDQSSGQGQGLSLTHY